MIMSKTALATTALLLVFSFLVGLTAIRLDTQFGSEPAFIVGAFTLFYICLGITYGLYKKNRFGLLCAFAVLVIITISMLFSPLFYLAPLVVILAYFNARERKTYK